MADIAKPRLDGLAAVRSANALTTGADKSQGHEMVRDWRRFLTTNFELTEDQRQWLDSVDQEREARVAELLHETIDSNGTLRWVVVMVAVPSQPGGFIHQLRRESTTESRSGDRSNITIAHCDANCQNWGWGED